MMPTFKISLFKIGTLQVKNEFYCLVYISHPMGGHLSGKIGQMCLGLIETGRVN